MNTGHLHGEGVGGAAARELEADGGRGCFACWGVLPVPLKISGMPPEVT